METADDRIESVGEMTASICLASFQPAKALVIMGACVRTCKMFVSRGARLSFTVLFLASLSLLTACDQSPRVVGAKTDAGVTHTNRQTFEVKGVVVKVSPGSKEVEIRHEEIPGYMPAMTMPFEVKSANELAGISPGDNVSFRLIVTDTEGWIENIKKLGTTLTNAPALVVGPGGAEPPGSKIRVLRDVEPLNIGDPLPEYHFTNQFGETFSTAQFKGQALAITFIFTRCPFPNFCPFTAHNFADTQQKLLAKSDGPKNWHLLTITFDPAFDTPAILKSYGKRYQYNPARWTLATGSLVDILALGEQFGLVTQPEQTGNISHNLRTVVIDAAGRVQKNIVGNSWTSDDLVQEMVKAAGVKP
jgi:protein SCO1/2